MASEATIDDDTVPDLADPAHDPVRAELARLLIAHKADIGLADRDDAVIVERVDDIAAYLFERHGRALLANDSAWLERNPWFADACDRLSADQSAVPMDG